MMAGPATDPTALSWCLAEIRESLARAETALEQQLQSDEAADGRLRAARGWLHQAHGALQVVDLEGVSVVTQEAEALLDRCDRGELPFDAGLVRAMARAFSAVIEYLEGVVAGSEDSPVSLFPHYRELLAMRGAERIEPSDLFTADLTVRAPRVPQGEPLSARAVARLRAAFEQGLLRFLRNPRDAEALGAMHGAVSRLHAAHGASGQRTFWWLSCAFLDALRVQALPVDVYAKRLVGRINLQLSRTLGGGAPIADRLLRDLLFMLARTGEARRLYRLTGTVPSDFETPRYAVVDARTLRAARDATTAAKLGWEKYVRGGSQELPAFAQAAQQLDAAVARLPWPGLQKLSGVLVGLRRALAAAGSSLAEVLSLEVATALLFVEQALERGARAIAQHDRRASEMAERLDRLCERQEGDGQAAPEWLTELSRAAQERLTTAAYVGELQANLRACEKVLDAFFRDPAAHRAELPPLGPLLRQVAGALRLLGHDEAADGADTVGSPWSAMTPSRTRQVASASSRRPRRRCRPTASGSRPVWVRSASSSSRCARPIAAAAAASSSAVTTMRSSRGSATGPGRTTPRTSSRRRATRMRSPTRRTSSPRPRSRSSRRPRSSPRRPRPMPRPSMPTPSPSTVPCPGPRCPTARGPTVPRCPGSSGRRVETGWVIRRRGRTQPCPRRPTAASRWTGSRAKPPAPTSIGSMRRGPTSGSSTSTPTPTPIARSRRCCSSAVPR